jgi:hypothetical protein
MRIRLAVPDELDDQDRRAALDAALESVTRTVTGLVRAGAAPPAAGEIKSGRVRWHPEPAGDEHFDLPDTIMKRGHGDCDDLAPWHAGSLRAAGIDPRARAFVKKSGPKRWHALVQRGDGSIEDPSLHAGMHSVSGTSSAVLGAGAPIQLPMAQDGRLCLAICPSRDRRHPLVWFARCDVPDQLEPWDWSSAAADQHPARAALKAIKAIRTVAGPDMEAEDDARLGAIHDLILGHDEEEVGDALHDLMGDEVDVDGCMEDALHSVGFFGDLFKAIASPITSAAHFIQHPSLKTAAHMFTDPVTSAIHAAQPIAHMAKPFAGALRFIPGIGPVAATGLDFLDRGGVKNFGDLTRFAMQQAPGFIPGVGPLMQQGGPLAMLMQQMQSGGMARPWGGAGPSVMRF